LKRSIVILMTVVMAVVVAFSLPAFSRESLHVQLILSPQAIAYIEENILPDFETRYDVDVLIEPVGWHNRLEKVLISTAGGAPPDIFMNGAEHVLELVELGVLHPIDREWESWDDREDFFPASLGSSTWKGHRYGVPVYTAPRVWWYRKDLFDQAGLDPENPPNTWDGLLEAAKRLTRTDGDRIVRQGYDLSRWNPGDVFAGFQDYTVFLWQAGGELFDPETYEPRFYSSEGSETLQFLINLRDAVLPPGYQDALPEGTGSPFFRGASAIYLAGGWVASEAHELQPDLAEVIAAIYPPPGHRVQVSAVFSDWLAIHAQSPNKELAWRLIQELTSPEALVEINLRTGLLSPRRSTVDVFAETNPLNAYLYMSMDYMRPFPVFPRSQDLMTAFHQEYAKAMAGTRGIESALEEAARLWRSLLAEQQ
jgi:ABC-type sugar transport system, periplasmic component